MKVIPLLFLLVWHHPPRRRSNTGTKHRPVYPHHTSHVLPWYLFHRRKHTCWSKKIQIFSASLSALSLSLFCSAFSVLLCSFSFSLSLSLSSLSHSHLFLTLCLMSSMESVRKMEDVGSLEDILLCGPWRAGKKEEWNRAGLWKPSRGATSRVILKYGSWKKKANSEKKAHICGTSWHKY